MSLRARTTTSPFGSGSWSSGRARGEPRAGFPDVVRACFRCVGVDIEGGTDRARTRPREGVLEQGDRIVAVDGQRRRSARLPAPDLEHRCSGVRERGAKRATPVVLRVERDGRFLTVRVKPRYDSELKTDPDRVRIRHAQPLDPGPVEAARIVGRPHVGGDEGNRRGDRRASSSPSSESRCRAWSAATR